MLRFEGCPAFAYFFVFNVLLWMKCGGPMWGGKWPSLKSIIILKYTRATLFKKTKHKTDQSNMCVCVCVLIRLSYLAKWFGKQRAEELRQALSLFIFWWMGLCPGRKLERHKIGLYSMNVKPIFESLLPKQAYCLGLGISNFLRISLLLAPKVFCD